MLTFLQRLSAILFFILAGSFFVCYILEHNDIGLPNTLLWLHVGQLPLASVALLYAGTSLIKSVTSETKPSAWIIFWVALPLVLLFLAFAALKFSFISIA